MKKVFLKKVFQKKVFSKNFFEKEMEDFLEKFPNKEQTKLFRNIELKKKQECFNETYYLYTNSFIKLVRSFIIYFINNGTEIEKKFFSDFVENNKRNVVNAYISRLYTKRPLVFLGENDRWKLKTGEYGRGWLNIGTKHEKEPLTIKNYLTYNELELSALLSISVKTQFINNGNRYNNGIKSLVNDYEKEGVYIGQVGSRFEKKGFMEWKYMVITEEQNTKENGYSNNSYGISNKREYMKMFEEFYKSEFPLYSDLMSDYKQGKLSEDFYFIPELNYFFNVRVYKQRVKYSISLFFEDAMLRARKENKKAYCYITGLGLGVWKLFDKQFVFYYSAILSLIKKNPRLKELISKVYIFTFEEILMKELFGEYLEDGFVEFGPRNPCDRISKQEFLNDSKQEILVANWAYDSNSYIGNEYWDGNYSASGDPAAASCSFIAYYGCPELNQRL